MNRKEIYKDKLQIDYFSESYIKFEEDFYRYSADGTPLTFIIDDILLSMALSHKTTLNLIRKNQCMEETIIFILLLSLVKLRQK